jgi:hypothetical protein
VWTGFKKGGRVRKTPGNRRKISIPKEEEFINSI